jgi:hypothetical protein
MDSGVWACHQVQVSLWGTLFVYFMMCPQLDPTCQIDRLFTTDHKAINHILMNDFDYQKPEPARWQLGRILGYGVLVVEGEKHKQQVVTSLDP